MKIVLFLASAVLSQTIPSLSWTVKLYNQDNIYVCNGVLVNQNQVITAASCIQGNITQWRVEGLSKSTSVLKWTKNPNYEIGSGNDISLWQLNSSINSDSYPNICKVEKSLMEIYPLNSSKDSIISIERDNCEAELDESNFCVTKKEETTLPGSAILLGSNKPCLVGIVSKSGNVTIATRFMDQDFPFNLIPPSLSAIPDDLKSILDYQPEQQSKTQTIEKLPIEITGFKPPTKPMPEDLRRLLDLN